MCTRISLEPIYPRINQPDSAKYNVSPMVSPLIEDKINERFVGWISLALVRIRVGDSVFSCVSLV